MSTTTTAATESQLATIRARRVDDTAREMMEAGVTLTHEQADELGDEACDWMSRRLGLQMTTDSEGVRFAPAAGDAE